MDPIRRDFRLTADLHRGEIDSCQVEIVQLVPHGELYFRDYAGALRPVAGEALHSGDLYVVTRLHPDLADAKHELAAELERRGSHLLSMAARCHEIEGVHNG